MKQFGTAIHFSSKRINDDTKDILNYLKVFSDKIGNTPFTAMKLMTYIHKETPTQVNITTQKIRSLLHNMATRGGIEKTVKDATAHNHQKYLLKSNIFVFDDHPKKIGKKRLESEPKFKTEKTKPDPQFEFEKKSLTFEDARNMKEMDVAFIGYSIVKEIEASLGMIQVLEEEVKHLRDESTKEEVFQLKMSDMNDKHKREVNILNEKISQLSRDVQKLNGQIVTKNAIIERLESSQNSKNTTFKMGELARLKNERPSHLR
jgi:hypothetical protein